LKTDGKRANKTVTKLVTGR